MAQPSSTPSPAQSQHHDTPADSTDVQIQAAETTNDSPTAAIPIPNNNDLERGDDLAATLVNEDDDEEPESSRSTSRWGGLTSVSLGAFAGRKGGEDRGR